MNVRIRADRAYLPVDFGGVPAHGGALDDGRPGDPADMDVCLRQRPFQSFW
jgi:hypothetical protein